MIQTCHVWLFIECFCSQDLVLKLVVNEQDNCTIVNLSIRVLGWIEGFLDTRFLIWHHYEDVIQLIHLHYIGLTMSVALLREGGKYYRKCKLFLKRVSETFQRCLSLIGCHKKWPPLKFTRKNELTNSLLKKLEFIWPIRRLFQFFFFLGLLWNSS